jgi:hypothetical protein
LIQVAADTPDNSVCCFLREFPVKTGKTYQAKVFVRSQNISPDARITMVFQGKDANSLFLGLPPQSANLEKPSDEKWEEKNLSFKIPEQGKWNEVRNLLVTLTVQNAKDGKVWFDDFELSETE